MSPCRTPTTAFLAGLLCALWLASPAAWAQYKWKDSRGQTHASDRPPPSEVPDKDVLQRPPPRRAAAATTAPSAGPASAPAKIDQREHTDPELKARQRQAEQQAQAKSQAEEARLAEQRAGNCQRARSQLAMLDSGQRLVRLDARGERMVVDDAVRASESQQARQAIDSNCR